MKHKQKKVQITGVEANTILFAFDRHYDTDSNGKVHQTQFSGLSLEEIQKLRDKLFAGHEHPKNSI